MSSTADTTHGDLLTRADALDASMSLLIRHVGCAVRCAKTEMFRIQLNIHVHTLRTPHTANWLKGGEWATKT